jgi:hypothetical protein
MFAMGRAWLTACSTPMLVDLDIEYFVTQY